LKFKLKKQTDEIKKAMKFADGYADADGSIAKLNALFSDPNNEPSVETAAQTLREVLSKYRHHTVNSLLSGDLIFARENLELTDDRLDSYTADRFVRRMKDFFFSVPFISSISSQDSDTQNALLNAQNNLMQAEQSISDNKTELANKIEENTQERYKTQREIEAVNTEIGQEKTRAFKNGEALVTQMYDTPEFREYFDASLFSDKLIPFLDTFQSMREFLNSEDAADYGRRLSQMGFDLSNDEHVQMIGDLLGVFNDSTTNSSITSTYNGNAVEVESRYDNRDSDILVRRSIKDNSTSGVIEIENDYFRQSRFSGMGRAALSRQIPAAIKTSQLTGKPVMIHCRAVSNPSRGLVGFHVWPKMGYNFQIPTSVKEKFQELGFTDEELSDTNSLFLSNRILQGIGYPNNTWNGLTAREVWGEVLDSVLGRSDAFDIYGEMTIDANNLDSTALQILRDYNEIERSRTKSVSASSNQYLQSIGFTEEDIIAFNQAWDMIASRNAEKSLKSLQVRVSKLARKSN
jgi:hypothetical protein